MKKTKSILVIFALLAANVVSAQTEKSQVIDNGGSGPYKAETVADASLTTHAVYRPADLQAAAKKEGKLPVILYANGGCQNNSMEARVFLTELASQGYIAIAIGPYDENDIFANWKGILTYLFPTAKSEVVLANGDVVKAPTAAETAAFMSRMEAEMKAAQEAEQKSAKSKKSKKTSEPKVESFQTYPRQMLEALDWLTDQNANPQSEYYHLVDLDHVAAMGQSCGGAQTLAVAHDPRIKTCVILNSGIGDMDMQGVTTQQLANLHSPMLYLIGGPTDIAYPNAAKDFERIDQVPVVMINTIEGHEGTYYEKNGGDYGKVVTKWLDWQLKGKIAQSGLFLNDDYLKMSYPEWTVQRKGF